MNTVSEMKPEELMEVEGGAIGNFGDPLETAQPTNTGGGGGGGNVSGCHLGVVLFGKLFCLF